MKKVTLFFLGCIFFFAITGLNNTYAFSVKPVSSSSLLQYQEAGDFVKLSFKEFASLTGEKENLWNKISFNVLQRKIKRDLKTNPGLSMSDYIFHPRHRHISTMEWILYGILIFCALLLIVIGVAVKQN
jgi:hypothetical protein